MLLKTRTCGKNEPENEAGHVVENKQIRNNNKSTFPAFRHTVPHTVQVCRPLPCYLHVKPDLPPVIVRIKPVERTARNCTNVAALPFRNSPHRRARLEWRDPCDMLGFRHVINRSANSYMDVKGIYHEEGPELCSASVSPERGGRSGGAG